MLEIPNLPDRIILAHPQNTNKIIREASEDADVKKLLEDIQEIPDNTVTLSHSFEVPTITLDIWQDRYPTSLYLPVIARGGLIHDNAKACIDAHILTKKSRLNEDEIEIMKTHPVSGYMIAVILGIPGREARFALNHHSFQENPYPSEKEIAALIKTFEGKQPMIVPEELEEAYLQFAIADNYAGSCCPRRPYATEDSVLTTRDQIRHNLHRVYRNRTENLAIFIEPILDRHDEKAALQELEQVRAMQRIEKLKRSFSFRLLTSV